MGAGLTYDRPLVDAVFLGRRKRFFADVRLHDGREVVAHCANTGSMSGLITPGAPCRVSPANNPKRKLQWTLEQIEADGGWVMCHTARPNRIVEAAILAGAVPELRGYAQVRRERPYGTRRSRIDLWLSGVAEPGTSPTLQKGPAPEGERVCLVEVKNVTLARGRTALFPDAVTERGRKHLEELADAAEGGMRAVLLLHVARDDVDRFEPAADIDPAYAEAFAMAMRRGVEMLAYTVAVSEQAVALARRIEVSAGT